MAIKYGLGSSVWRLRSTAWRSEYPRDRRVWFTAIGVCKPEPRPHLDEAHQGANPSCNNPITPLSSISRVRRGITRRSLSPLDGEILPARSCSISTSTEAIAAFDASRQRRRNGQLRCTKPGLKAGYSSRPVFAKNVSRLPCSPKDTFSDTSTRRSSASTEPSNLMSVEAASGGP
jgi:hypothetical protein